MKENNTRLAKETETVEYKKTTGELKEGIISIVSMLNKHNRGELYFGVCNDGKIIGQDLSDKTLRDISQAIANHIQPQIVPTIQSVSINDKVCIHIKFEGENVPYFAYHRAFIRVADEDRALSPSELRDVFAEQILNYSFWDNEPSDRTIEDIDEAAFTNFITKANTNGRINYNFTTKKDMLNKLGLIKDKKLTNTAKIMFTNRTDLELQMAIFATNERLTFNDIKRESGTISELVSVAEKYIKNNIKWRVEFDGSIERKEIPEIPLEAIREALVNSFCHKDYRVPQNNEVSIYKNRVEIYSSGTFPKGRTPDDFIYGSERSIKRNPQLAQMLYYSKDVESFGTGLRRIANACKNAGVKVDFQMLKAGFAVVFYRDESGEDEIARADIIPTSADIVPTSADIVPISADIMLTSADIIMQFLNANSKITNKQAREITNLSSTRIKVIFKTLCDSGVVVAHGENKGRYYTLK